MPKICNNWNWGWLWVVPLCTGLTLGLGIITTYSIAVGKGHLRAILPSISDTGINKPEMQIFSQVLNVSAFLVAITICLRFKMIHTVAEEEDSEKLKVISYVSLAIGLLAAAGLSVVGNFQDNLVAVAHIAGALCAFFFGNVYTVIDAYVTWRMHPKYNRIGIFIIRVAIGVIGILAFVICVTGCALSPWDPPYKAHWGPHDPGYRAHLAFTFGEWIMGFSFLGYFFTYVNDFSKFHLTVDLHHRELLNADVMKQYIDIDEDARLLQ